MGSFIARNDAETKYGDIRHYLRPQLSVAQANLALARVARKVSHADRFALRAICPCEDFPEKGD
ncbi:MAG: hypothetical protein Q8Q62_03535, partial [Mesorhizobium sp.]|nr:hypothetical protein [Mesorhizobium sp.]